MKMYVGVSARGRDTLVSGRPTRTIVVALSIRALGTWRLAGSSEEAGQPEHESDVSFGARQDHPG
jgi:hypothetical protein